MKINVFRSEVVSRRDWPGNQAWSSRLRPGESAFRADGKSGEIWRSLHLSRAELQMFRAMLAFSSMYVKTHLLHSRKGENYERQKGTYEDKLWRTQTGDEGSLAFFHQTCSSTHRTPNIKHWPEECIQQRHSALKDISHIQASLLPPTLALSTWKTQRSPDKGWFFYRAPGLLELATLPLKDFVS